jgi:hypothetical protein
VSRKTSAARRRRAAARKNARAASTPWRSNQSFPDSDGALHSGDASRLDAVESGSPAMGARAPLLPPTARTSSEDYAASVPGSGFEMLNGSSQEAEADGDSPGALDDDDPWWEVIDSSRTAAPRRASLRQRVRQLTSLVMPFSPRERAISRGHFRTRLVLLGALMVLVAITALGSVAAFGFAAKVASGAGQFSMGSTASTPPGGVVIQPLGGGVAPTPTPARYLIGTWVSDSAPASGGVTVFVRVSRGEVSNQGSPVAGVPVRISVGGASYGPTDTNAYGLAAFNVGVGGGFDGSTPVFVTATAVVAGQTLTAQTSFAPR